MSCVTRNRLRRLDNRAVMLYNLGVERVIEKAVEVLKPYADRTVCIGVSGGRDSMCLLHAVLTCGIFDVSHMIVLHVNHNLRMQAVRDEQFVREFCRKNGIEFRCVSVDAAGEAARRGQTVEQAARDLRYDAFYSLIKSGEAGIILTAHHALDNAESVLMHLFRGAGIDGMRGISARGDRIVRPFIDVYPEELDEYARAHSIDYVVDETNFVDDADRNFIRLNVMPLIQKRYAGAVRAVNGFARDCGEVCEFLDGALDFSLISRDRDAVTIADRALLSSLATRYVRRAMAHFSLVDLTREQIDNTVALVGKKTGAVAELSCGVKAAREYGCVSLYIPRLPCGAELALKTGANFIDGLAVDVALSNADPKSIRGGVVDLDKISGATLRFRRDGDMFAPFGGKRKKFKQYLIDMKIPKRLRDRIPVVARGNEVLVAVGINISDGVAVTDSTVRQAVISLRSGL